MRGRVATFETGGPSRIDEENLESVLNMASTQSVLKEDPPECTAPATAPTRLLNGNFVLLWQGQAVSQLGTHVYMVGLIFWVKHATESASLMALMVSIPGLIGLILAPLGGTVADRYSRRRIIIVSDVVRGAIVLPLAALLFFVPTATEVNLLYLFAVAVGMAITGAFFGPAISSAIPDLVPPRNLVVRANSLRQVTAQMTFFVGRMLGAQLYVLVGAPLLVLFNSLSFFVSAFTECFMEIPQTVTQESDSWKDSMRKFKTELIEGLQYVYKSGGLKRLLVFSAVLNFFTTPIVLLLPFYVEDFLGLDLEWYVYLMMVYSAGILFGASIVGTLRMPGRTRCRWMILLGVMQPLYVIAIGLSPHLYVAVTAAFMLGAMGAFNGINITSIIQTSTPGHIRGRVMGVLTTISGSIAPLGMALGGVAYDLSGSSIPAVYITCGAVLFLLAAVQPMHREFRDFLAYEPSS